MWRYLSAAFWARLSIAGLGGLPLNAVAVTGCAILGLANPGFWFLGAGLEIVYLWLLVANPRFRRVIDAQGRPVSSEPDPAAREAALIARLPASGKTALERIDSACARILELLANGAADSYIIEASREALDRQRWTYLKLLVAEAALQSGEWDEPEATIQARVAALDAEISAAPGTSLAASKQATREILVRRLSNRGERARQLAEIAADRARIEAQLDLAKENAAIQGRPLAIPGEIELASGLLDFGAATPEIRDLERQRPQLSATSI